MLYSCPCDQRVVDIPTHIYFQMSESYLQDVCTQGNGWQISNPFHSSHLGAKGIDLTSKQEEIEEEEEYEEEEDPIDCDLNLPPEFFEQ